MLKTHTNTFAFPFFTHTHSLSLLPLSAHVSLFIHLLSPSPLPFLTVFQTSLLIHPPPSCLIRAFLWFLSTPFFSLPPSLSLSLSLSLTQYEIFSSRSCFVFQS